MESPPSSSPVLESADFLNAAEKDGHSSSLCSQTVSWKGAESSPSGCSLQNPVEFQDCPWRYSYPFSMESWRDSPSYRSQDSGYSDSGESNNGCLNDVEETATPQVKHITRVYFTGNDVPSNVVNETITLPSADNTCTKRVYRTGRRRYSTTNQSKTESDRKALGNSDTENGDTVSYVMSPTTTFHSAHDVLSSNEEADIQLENKSVNKLYVSRTEESKLVSPGSEKDETNSASEDINQRQFPDPEKSSILCKALHSKRIARRSNSSDRLLESSQVNCTKESIFAKAKRRWSSSEFRCKLSAQDVTACLPFQSNNEDEVQQNDREADQVSQSCKCIVEGRQEYPSVVFAANTCGLPPSPAESLALAMRNDALAQWLRELRVLIESECMNTLQSKSLSSPSGTGKQRRGSVSTFDSVLAIQERAHIVSTEFARLCQRLENLELLLVPPLAESLVSYIQVFITDYTSQLMTHDSNDQSKCSLYHQTHVIHQICESLRAVCSKGITTNRCYPSEGELNQEVTKKLVKIVTALGHAFTKLVDIMLCQEIKSLVNVLEDSADDSEVQDAVCQLTAMGIDGGHFCRLIGRVGGVRALLSVCVESRYRHIRVLVLRALATVCCVAEGIAQLEDVGGVEIVSEILCDEFSADDERSEAAAVLAQITSPFVENSIRLCGIHRHLKAIAEALTDLARNTTSSEVFLLASAALANLTFLEGGCMEALVASNAHKVLLEKATPPMQLSVFTKDQIVTVVANLSASKEAAEEVVKNAGLEILFSFLKTSPSKFERVAEVTAAEKVQQKSAIALSRLCSDPDVAKKVLKSGQVGRLVQLCKVEEERNHSDAVLVACLAALRKIASHCGFEELREIDAVELVEPKLLDSFLIYSSKQESYV